MLLGATRVSLPNGISFCPTALAWYTSVSVTDITDKTDRWTTHEYICCSRRNHWCNEDSTIRFNQPNYWSYFMLS